MVHVRMVCPPDLVRAVLDYLGRQDSVINIVHLAGAARKPDGDVVTCDVAREDASVVLATLEELGCSGRGTIAVESIEASLSRAATAAEKHARGAAADAVVWEELAARSTESAELSLSFALFMVLATCISAVAILTDSVVLLIGGMIVGPEFGPLAGVCVGLVQRRRGLLARSSVALVGGFALGVAAAALFTFLLLATGVTSGFDGVHPQTLFISQPDRYSFVIALLAGVAGMYSLTTSKPTALIGVFVSVTTIPAAANMGVSAAHGHMHEVKGAALQLLLNVTAMVVAGTLTLLLQRLAFLRRWRTARRTTPRMLRSHARM